jgi:hypothetical protein
MPNQNAINDPGRPNAAPIEFAGQWVAWNRERSKIIAHGGVLAEVHKAAIEAGHPDAILQKVRRPGSFIGAT